MSRRLLALPLAVLGLLLAAPSAFAVGPSAIGTGSDGTSYVGYPLTGGIQRIAVDGTALPSWGLPGAGEGQLGGIVAIGAAPGANGNVFVLDTNLRVQEFTKGGTWVKGTQLPACTNGTPDATKYGGLDVRVDGATSTTPVAIYVAHPCANQVLKLDPASPTLAVTQTATTTSRPGRIASPRYLTGPTNTRAVYVSLPDARSVVSFAPADLGVGPDATRTYDYTPSDLFVDEEGVLFVGDVSNNGVRLYDSAGSQFRYLGGTGSALGLVAAPQAFDVAGQDGTDKAGNLFIADTGNERVQRWNSYGYTFWGAAATGTGGGPVVQPPTSGAPSISGSAVVGQSLTCNPGTWTGSPSFTYSWRRDGSEVGTGASYTVVAADVGKALTCRVTGTNTAGSAEATSAPVTPAAAPVVQTPVNTGAPAIQGSAVVGQQLTCTQGTWSNAPTGYAYSWRRDGTQIATGSTYTLVAADAGRQITCAVTASNSAGSATSVSGAVSPSTPVQAPVSTGAPQIQGTAAVGQQLTCTQGTWSNAPTGYTYSWRRDGGEVATAAQYTLTAADAGRSITCVVTATNAGGSASAGSGAVSPPAPVAAPQNTERPGIQGTTVVGNTLTCTPGGWTGSPTSYAYSWRRDGAAIADATGATYALVAADAGRTITCTSTATNAGGATTAVSDGVVVTAAPSTPSTRVGVTINNGAEATNTAAVTLRIREPAGATAVLISNDGSFDTPTQLPVAANDTYSWTLDARGSQKRARVVYVRFVGVLLDANQTFQDDILLDTSAPTVTTATISARSSAKSATVRVAATDSGSGVQQIQYSGTKSTKKAKTLKLKKSRSFKVKPKNAKWVRAVDVAGNASKWKRIAYKAPQKGKR